MTFRVWAVRAGGDSEADPLFIENGQIAVSFRDVDQDVSALPAQRSAFKDAFAQSGEAKPSAIPAQAGQLFRFVHEMRIGDRVIYPCKIDRTLLWGEIATPYIYDRTHNPSFPHRRGVRWLASLSRDVFSQGALYELGSVLTLFELRNFAAEFTRRFAGDSAVKSLVLNDDETEARVTRDIAETTRDFIASGSRPI
jgi:restriction system protein